MRQGFPVAVFARACNEYGTSLLAAFVVAALVSPPRSATLATFASPWWGHDRGLSVTRDGRALEAVDDGCCHRAVALRLRLSRPRGTPQSASVTARVVSVHVYDRRYFGDAHLPVPRVGDTATLRLRHGILVEPLTGADYCRPRRSGCGA